MKNEIEMTSNIGNQRSGASSTIVSGAFCCLNNSLQPETIVGSKANISCATVPTISATGMAIDGKMHEVGAICPIPSTTLQQAMTACVVPAVNMASHTILPTEGTSTIGTLTKVELRRKVQSVKVATDNNALGDFMQLLLIWLRQLRLSAPSWASKERGEAYEFHVRYVLTASTIDDLLPYRAIFDNCFQACSCCYSGSSNLSTSTAASNFLSTKQTASPSTNVSCYSPSTASCSLSPSIVTLSSSSSTPVPSSPATCMSMITFGSPSSCCMSTCVTPHVECCLNGDLNVIDMKTACSMLESFRHGKCIQNHKTKGEFGCICHTRKISPVSHLSTCKTSSDVHIGECDLQSALDVDDETLIRLKKRKKVTLGCQSNDYCHCCSCCCIATASSRVVGTHIQSMDAATDGKEGITGIVSNCGDSNINTDESGEIATLFGGTAVTGSITGTRRTKAEPGGLGKPSGMTSAGEADGEGQESNVDNTLCPLRTKLRKRRRIMAAELLGCRDVNAGGIVDGSEAVIGRKTREVTSDASGTGVFEISTAADHGDCSNHGLVSNELRPREETITALEDLVNSLASENGIRSSLRRTKCCAKSLMASHNLKSHNCPNLTSDIAGVRFHKQRNTWAAYWKDGGRQICKYFPVAKYGFHEAKQIAVATRIQAEKERGILAACASGSHNQSHTNNFNQAISQRQSQNIAPTMNLNQDANQRPTDCQNGNQIQNRGPILGTNGSSLESASWGTVGHLESCTTTDQATNIIPHKNYNISSTDHVNNDSSNSEFTYLNNASVSSSTVDSNSHNHYNRMSSFVHRKQQSVSHGATGNVV